MKRILRHYVIDTVALYLVSRTASGLVFERGAESLLLAGVGLTIVSLLAKPVINILLLPINLVTFGLFRWVSSAILLYLVTLVVPGFKIVGFIFKGISIQGINIPALSLSGLLAIAAFSFLISFLTSFIYWLIK